VRRVLGGPVLALSLLLFAAPVLASHDWLQLYQRTNVGYGYKINSYTDSDGNNNRVAPWHADYEYTDVWLAHDDYDDPIWYPTATCSGANACEHTQTTTYTAPHDVHFWLRSMHCGKDVVGGNTHESPYNDVGLGPCSPHSLNQFLRFLEWDN
jgi:hypothetical protein